jgi:hypothetical protein
MTIRYCTPIWLEESARLYGETPRFEQELKRVTTKIFFRITAYPDWGIDDDIIFGAIVDEGKLLNLAFYSEDAARSAEGLILATDPPEWKAILRKEKKFITEFMMGKISLEEGSRVALLKITPYANHFVDALTQFELQFPDEMSAEELDTYRADVLGFRKKLEV